jgi:Thioesterase-like superfamily
MGGGRFPLPGSRRARAKARTAARHQGVRCRAPSGMISNMNELPPAYYLPLGDGYFEPTEATTSPWDTKAQHGGPPTALLASCLDDAFGRPDMRVARISMDFLGPVPRTALLVQIELLRPGRRTQLSEASLWAGDRRVCTARVWHLATGPGPATRETDPVLSEPALGPDAGDASAGPGPISDAGVPEDEPGLPADLPEPQPQQFFDGVEDWGYGHATEWRTVSGGYASSTGAAAVWTRVRIPLVAGRRLDGLARFAIVADSANGLSAPLSFHEWLFIPPGVTMHLFRYPAGDWVRLTASSDPGRNGIGLAEGTLSDAFGRCGTVTQPLLVAPRTRS